MMESQSEDADYLQMSQDCVEWNDEVDGADNAAVAEPSASTTTTHYNNTNNNTTNRNLSSNSDNSDKHEIESLFSLLGKNGEEQILPAVLPQQQQQQNGNDEVPTPVHRNANRHPQSRHSFPPSTKEANPSEILLTHANNTSSNASAGARKKRPVSLGSHHHLDNSRQDKIHKRSSEPTTTTTTAATTSPVPVFSTASKRRLSSSSDGIMTGFDDLLQQVETPSPPTTGAASKARAAFLESQQQQQDVSQSMATKPNPRLNAPNGNSINNNSAALESRASSTACRMKPKALGDHEFRKHDKENLSARRAQQPGKGPSQRQSDSQQQNSNHSQQQNQNQNRVIALSDRITHEAPKINTNKTEHNNSQSQHTQQQQQQQQQQQSTTFRDQSAQPTTQTNNRNAQSNTQVKSTATPKPTAATADAFGDDDEFGDFGMTDADFAQVDCLVAATQAQEYSQLQETTPSPQKVPSAPTLSNSGATSSRPPPRQQQTSTNVPAPALAANRTHRPDLQRAPSVSKPDPITSRNGRPSESKAELKNIKLEKQNEDDEFGDFPDDIDFDALDQAISSSSAAIPSTAQSGTTMITHPLPPPTKRTEPKIEILQDDDPFDDFPDDIDFDALDAAVAATQAAGPANAFSQQTTQPPPNCTVHNPRSESWHDETSYLAFSRYKIVRFEKDEATYTQRLFVKPWDDSMLDSKERQSLHKPSTLGRQQLDQVQVKEDTADIGMLILRGSWFYLDAENGDILHICSLTGRFKTDASALPLILDTDPPQGSTYDDLVPIIHPELLAIPTTVTETLDCPRRSVLKHRLGSKFSSSKALLLGTLRHTLFEVALKSGDTSPEFLRHHIKKIVRAEAPKLVGCRMSSAEAERELSKFWPHVQSFKREYINATPETNHRFANLSDISSPTATKFAATEVKGVEEEVTSPELGLKGNVDVLVEAMTAPTHDFDRWLANGGPNSPQAKSLMSVELKTHHNANPQPKHFAQLTYYTVMLLSRFGHTESTSFKRNPEAMDAIAGSMLLYINAKSMKALHVAPRLTEIKSLIEQRNTFCSASVRASRPRGVTLSYDDDEKVPKLLVSEATPAVLPALQREGQCSRCFSARECMVYATSGSSPNNDIKQSHAKVIDQFTEQLTEVDLEYFRNWDRLIDLEADATSQSVAEAWLETSEIREKSTGKCISSLVYHPQPSQIDNLPDDDSVAFIVFERSSNANLRTPLPSLGVQKGSYVTCSTDATSLDSQRVRNASASVKRSGRKQAPFRHQMKIFRGTVDHIDGNDKITIKTSDTSVVRINDLLSRFHETGSDAGAGRPELTFRLDVDNSFSQMGTLRTNVIDLLTKDKEEDKSKEDPALRSMWIQKRYSRLRELVVRLQPPVYDEALKESMFNPPARVRSLPGCDPGDLVMEFTTMNENQRTAAQQVASMRDYTLVQGLPGTGKTSTIVFVARMLAAQGKRVLITSYTHSAVDNCMLKIIDSGVAAVWDERPTPSVLRIGEKSSVHPGVQSILASKVATDLENYRANEGDDDIAPSAESYRKVLAAARIVGVSVLKIPKSPLLAGEHFDVVIVDEAGQITQPALLGAIAAADTFVLVGDHMQLPPLVVSESALAGGFGDSMLKRLAEAHPDVVVQLKLQYRMHKEICSLASNAIYNGNLANAVEVPRLQLQNFPKALSAHSFGLWAQKVVNPFRPVVFADTDGIGKQDGPMASEHEGGIIPLERAASRQAGGNMVNDTEAILVSRIIEALVAVGVSPSCIGVICPFNAQIRLLDESPKMKHFKTEGLEVSTIDKYQGRDKEVIIVSFVRSNNKGKVGRLLEDKRRINVAITRSKRKLILVGSFSTLQKGSETLKGILGQIQQLKRVEKLPANAV